MTLPMENERYLRSGKCLNSQGLHRYFKDVDDEFGK